MDRREFLKTSGLGLAAAGIAASCQPGPKSQPYEARTSEDMARHCGSIGLLGFGCMRFPMTKDENGAEVIDQEYVNSMVDLALSKGVNYYDTSPVYLRGESEAATAKALLRHPRENYLLATKASNFGEHDFESSKAMYLRSLDIFQTDHMDYYLLHALSGEGDLKERFLDNGFLDYLLEERKSGRIRNLGFSFHGNQTGFDELMALHGKYHWDFVQIQMNYVDWNLAKRDAKASYMYERLSELDIPVVVMEPLLGGRLASVPAALAAELKEREPSRTIASWAFRFFGRYPKVQVVLSGMSEMDHLTDNLNTFLDYEPLSEEEEKFLFHIAQEMDKYPLVRCTACQYCMPCPYGIDIPGIFRFYNKAVREGTYVVSSEQKGYEKARRRYLLEYDKSIPTIRQADHCIACGKCVKSCPQHIPIPGQLRRIDKYIEALKQGKL